MICRGCVNNLVRVRDGERETLCILDMRRTNLITECNFKFEEVKEEKVGDIVDLGYGAMEELVVKKRGWPKGKARK